MFLNPDTVIVKGRANGEGEDKGCLGAACIFLGVCVHARKALVHGLCLNQQVGFRGQMRWLPCPLVGWLWGAWPPRVPQLRNHGLPSFLCLTSSSLFTASWGHLPNTPLPVTLWSQLPLLGEPRLRGRVCRWQVDKAHPMDRNPRKGWERPGVKGRWVSCT